MSVYSNKLFGFHPHWGLDQGFNFFISRISLFIIFILLMSFWGCSVEIPAAAKDLAISALCEFPPYSGQNICRDVEVTEVYREPLTREAIKQDFQSCWCLELSYVDFTGHSGFASIWVVGESGSDGYHILEGPYLAVPCSLNHN